VTAFDGEGNDASVAAVELARGESVAGVAGKSWVGDMGHPGVTVEEGGDGLGGLALPA